VSRGSRVRSGQPVERRLEVLRQAPLADRGEDERQEACLDAGRDWLEGDEPLGLDRAVGLVVDRRDRSLRGSAVLTGDRYAPADQVAAEVVRRTLAWSAGQTTPVSQAAFIGNEGKIARVL